jgi:hypothetical protein
LKRKWRYDKGWVNRDLIHVEEEFAIYWPGRIEDEMKGIAFWERKISK